MTIYVDHDDDDADGRADSAGSAPTGAAAADVVPVEAASGKVVRKVTGDAARLLLHKQVVAPDALAGRKVNDLMLQGVQPGTLRLELDDLIIDARVVKVVARDTTGKPIDLATSHASLSRVLPAGLRSPRSKQGVDRDALSWLLVGPAAALPDSVTVRSLRPDGSRLDELTSVALSSVACPADVASGLACKSTATIRATPDDVGRRHPAAAKTSLAAEVGGRITVEVAGRKAAAIRVGGPRQSPVGSLSRYRGRLRLHIVRIAAGGDVPFGGDDRGARFIARQELRSASALWGQCGIHFGDESAASVEVVDPPPPHLVAIGCDAGLPATGDGRVSVAVAGNTVRVQTRAGDTPERVARRLASALERAGLEAPLSANPRIGPGALRTVDVLVRDAKGGLVAVAAPEGEAISTDSTLGACLGEVDLSDGLTHFGDFDAAAGTVEERSLVKAFEDGDPTTVDVFYVPSFARTGRIGATFIASEHASVRNAIIVDRAAVRAGARSYALAHELGHVLLDMPGHPDDYGVDRSSSLMDADAADPTIFGPRRLSVSECVRAIRQSGPKAPVPLLEPWPLYEKP